MEARQCEPRGQYKVNEVEENEAEAGVMKVYLNSRTPQPKEARAFVLISAEDWERVRKHSWSATNKGYARARVLGKMTMLHRFLMNPPAGMVVDHISGRTYDNTRGNLRICSPSENSRNARKRVRKQDPNNPRPVCEFPGVSWHAPAKKWVASIRVEAKTRYLGIYTNPVEAAHVAHEARLKHFGEFAPRIELPPRPTRQEA